MKIRLSNSFWIGLALLALAACSPDSAVEPAALPMTIVVTRPVTVNSPTPIPTETPRPALTAETTPISLTPTPIPPYPGLIYQNEDGLWRVGSDWQPTLLVNRDGGVLSPDGLQVAYLMGNDVMVFDLATGQELNITADSGRRHCCVQWWAARPGTLLLGSWGSEDAEGPSTGRLTLVNSDGHHYQVVGNEQSNAAPAGSPDGQTIAYDLGGRMMLYNLADNNSQPFTSDDFAVPEGITILQSGSPAWSPDGQTLAWMVTLSNPEQNWISAVALFDLSHRQVQFIHPYNDIIGRDGWFDPPVWSPNGQWLAFKVESIDPTTNGIWVTVVGSSEEHYLGAGSRPVWSPNNDYLAFNSFSPNREPLYWMVSTTWYAINLYIPGKSAFLVGWEK